MQPGSNPIEEYKETKDGNPLLIRDDLPQLISRGWESLSSADKELLKWIGVFFRKPTPGKFMMRIRMPNGFATSAQLVAIADLSKRLGNGNQRSEEHTSELQSQFHLVCRLLLEKKKNNK